MGKDVTLTCDGCGNDLSRSSNCEDYRLRLANEHVPSVGGCVTAMGAYPAIKHDVYFCEVACLRKWLDENYPVEKGPYHGGKCWAEYQRKQRAAGAERRWL